MLLGLTLGTRLYVDLSFRHQITDQKSFGAFWHHAFVQAVSRAANPRFKYIEAIKSGKLRAVALSLSTMSSRHQITDHKSFEALRHSAFVQVVNRLGAANLKCIEAIKSGKLRADALSWWWPFITFADLSIQFAY